MPSPRGLETLVRKEPLTEEDWFELIEARRELIKPHLDSFTLPELGSVECLQHESFWHGTAIDGPTLIGDDRFSLKTQGLFWRAWGSLEHVPDSGYRGRSTNYPDGVIRVWGLTRSCLWIIAEIAFTGEPGYKDRGYQRAKTVEIAEADLPAIATITKEPRQQMWKHFGEVITRMAAQRLMLYNSVLKLANLVEAEELAFSLIPLDREEEDEQES